LAYVTALFLFHVPFFVVSQQWLLLVLTTWAALVWLWTVLRTQCIRCYNLFCPFNRVPEDVRAAFFRNYPSFAEAWGKEMPKDEG
jgi:hypothetical protein